MRRAHAAEDWRWFFLMTFQPRFGFMMRREERERSRFRDSNLHNIIAAAQQSEAASHNTFWYYEMRNELLLLRWEIGVKKKGKKARRVKKWKKHKSWGEDPNTEEMWKRMWEEWDRFSSLSVGCFTRAVCESESICIENNPLFIIYNSNRLKSFAVPFSLFSFTARCCSLSFLPFLSWSTRPNLGVWAQRELTERHIFQRTSSLSSLRTAVCNIRNVRNWKNHQTTNPYIQLSGNLKNSSDWGEWISPYQINPSSQDTMKTEISSLFTHQRSAPPVYVRLSVESSSNPLPEDDRYSSLTRSRARHTQKALITIFFQFFRFFFSVNALASSLCTLLITQPPPPIILQKGLPFLISSLCPRSLSSSFFVIF